jgi:tetratricopeptide (TPR) repeat protein/predicted AlkP superfamily phosphohydrolase/phosphomutase
MRNTSWKIAAAVVVLAGVVWVAFVMIGRDQPGEPGAPATEPAPLPVAAIPDRNVVVIGLDGLDWDILDPLIERGELPNLGRLAREGARARLRTVTPVLSPVIWTSVATGKGPTKHGIMDFLAQRSDGSMLPVTSTLRQSKALWNLLGDAGVPVAITAWWATWPAESVQGYMATDRISYQLFKDVITEEAAGDPAAEGRGKTWPPELFDDLAPLIVRPDEVIESEIARFVDLDALGRRDEDDRGRLEELATVLASTRTYEAIGLDLLRRQPRGLHAVYNESTDTAAHLFMTFRPPRRPGVDARRAAAFGGVIDAVYREADAMVGRVLDAVGDGWTVVICSDHGFKHGENRPATDPRIGHGPGADWHDRFGVLILWGPDIRAGVRVADASVLDITPTILALFGLPVGEDMDGRVLDQALEPDFLSRHPLTHIATYERGTTAPREVEPLMQDADLMEKLRSLGYIAGDAGLDDAGEGDGVAGSGGETYSQDSARAFLNRGVVLMGQRDLEGALREFRQAEREGGGTHALINIATVQMLEREFDEAEATIDHLETLAPDARFVPALRGVLADLRGDRVEAERLLRETLRLDPADSRARTRLGHVLEVTGRPAEALAEYETAIRTDPENAQAFNYAGNLYRQGGDLGKAESYYRRSVETDPRYAGAYNNLGLLLQETGRFEEAVALYEKGLEYAPESALLHNSLGSLLILRRDLDGAERELRRAMEIDPGMAEPFINLGIVLAERGRLADAAQSFGRALDADPRRPDAHFNVAKLKLIQGDHAGGLEAFARTLSIAPRYFDAAIGAGETAYRLGRDEEAVRFFEQANAIDPGVSRVHRRLGELYLRQGDRQAAAAAWQRSLELDPNQPDLRSMLGELGS